MVAADLLARIAKAMEGVTPGPWDAWGGHGWPPGIREAMGWEPDSVPEGVWWPVCGPGGQENTIALVADKHRESQAFISAARTLLPEAADALKIAVEALQECRMLGEYARGLTMSGRLDHVARRASVALSRLASTPEEKAKCTCHLIELHSTSVADYEVRRLRRKPCPVHGQPPGEGK